MTDRDALCGDGIRVPFGNRISQRMDSLGWGTMSDSNASDDVFLLSDCYHVTQMEYDSIAISGEKMGHMGEAAFHFGFSRNVSGEALQSGALVSV